jgi:hypothetical protein
MLLSKTIATELEGACRAQLKLDCLSSNCVQTNNLFKTCPNETITKCQKRLILLSCNEGFVYGLQTSEFTLFPSGSDDRTRTYIYIEKVDSSGHASELITLDAQLSKRLVKGYLKYCQLYCVGSRISVHLFARSQPQYLFPLSAKSTSKRILSERNLIRWWKKTLSFACVNLKVSSAYWFVPGESTQTLGDIVRATQNSDESLKWNWGLQCEGAASNEMATKVIPSFPDDAKTKAMSLAGTGATIGDVKELLATTGECGSGRMAGFFGFTLRDDSAHGKSSTDAESGGCALEDYEKLFTLLMRQDFSSDCATRLSTKAVMEWFAKSSNAGYDSIVINASQKDAQVKENVPLIAASSVCTTTAHNLQSFVKRKTPSNTPQAKSTAQNAKQISESESSSDKPAATTGHAVKNIQGLVEPKAPSPAITVINNLQGFVKRKPPIPQQEPDNKRAKT